MVEMERKLTPVRASITDTHLPTQTAQSSRLAAVFRAEELAGLKLATQARLVGLSIIAVWVFVSNPLSTALYAFEASLVLFSLSGLAHYVSSQRFDWPWLGPLFILFDFVLLTGTLLVLNSYLRSDWPPALILRVTPFAYFFLLGAVPALSYSPRLMVWTGIIGVLSWAIGVLWVCTQPESLVAHPPNLIRRCPSGPTRQPQFCELA